MSLSKGPSQTVLENSSQQKVNDSMIQYGNTICLKNMEFNNMDSICFKVINMNESFAEMCDQMNACVQSGALPLPNRRTWGGCRGAQRSSLAQLDCTPLSE